jgi:large subunit ribosomal protein L28
MAARVNIQSLRKTFPAILDLPSVTTGNNVPKSYHKTRRTWHPNVQRIDQPLRVLDTANKTRQGGSVLKGVKMTMRHLRTFEKSGGVEGTLVSGLICKEGDDPIGWRLMCDPTSAAVT